jgi:membrane protease YdiL (CAAX protease family)
VSWGLAGAFIGIGVGLAWYVVTSAATAVVAEALGHQLEPQDVGDVFAKAGAIAQYADRLLAALASGEQRPPEPHLLADQATLRIGFAFTLLYHVGIVAIGVILVARGPRRLWDGLGLGRMPRSVWWMAPVATIGAYVGVVAYSLLAEAFGLDVLVPESTVPWEITREASTLALAGVAAVIGAPIAEELLFRGYFFGGLAARWGFWPAALLSGALFSANHLDPGSFLPFWGVGVLLAWLFWRTETLWASIVMHLCFNGISFALLALGVAT